MNKWHFPRAKVIYVNDFSMFKFFIRYESVYFKRNHGESQETEGEVGPG